MLYNEDIDFEEARNIPADIDLEQDYIFREELEIIRDVLERLPETVNKEVIKMNFGFYDRRYTQKEIAKILNCSQSTVSRIVKNAKEALRSDFERVTSIEPKQLKKTNKKETN